MRYGFIVTSGDPRTAAELAAEAEAAGWDGVFSWDGMFIDGYGPFYDPWVVMAAMAMRTERVRLGAIVTPLSRRRPWKVAYEVGTLDHLSGGRMILPVGLGALDDGAFGKVGEATDRRVRAERLDEALAIITGLWRGEPFSFAGAHYRVEEVTFVPPPPQRPRVPIWVVAFWPSPRSMARALRYDGLLPNVRGDGSEFPPRPTPGQIAEIAAYAAAHRPAGAPFEIVMDGVTPADDPRAAAEIVRPYADAGATWWIESMWEAPNAPDDLRRRIAAGPPRLDG